MDAIDLLLKHYAQKRSISDKIDDMMGYDSRFLAKMGNERVMIQINGETFAQSQGVLPYVSDNNVRRGGGTLLTVVTRLFKPPVLLVIECEPPRPILLNCELQRFVGIDTVRIKQDYSTNWHTINFSVTAKLQALLAYWLTEIVNERD